MPKTLLMSGITENLFDAATTTVTPSSSKALPAGALNLMWGYRFSGGNPATIAINLEVSDDDTNWKNIDTLSSNSGAAISPMANGSFLISANFVRTNITGVTGSPGTITSFVRASRVGR